MTRRHTLRILLASAIVILGGMLSVAKAVEPLEIRAGVLKFGTVNWELDVIAHHGLDRAAGVKLTVMPFASPRATQVALLGGAVDVIVGDWVWVSRQRHAGADFTFIPYSTSVGALMAAPGSPIKALADIKGRRLGIAGGPLDKSWLLAQARLAADGKGAAAVLKFGAPPLLSALLARGELDGVMTYWHYAARLEAGGMRRVVDVGDIARDLGVTSNVPLLGYVFSEKWAEANRASLVAFSEASRQAKQLLAADPREWERIGPLLRAEDEATAAALRKGYIAGIPKRWGDAERADAARLYGILARTGGPAFSDGKPGLAPGTFWSAVTY